MERRSQQVSLIASSILLLVLVVAAFWQTSLDFGDFRPGGTTETIVLWGISTLIPIGVLALGFIVFRSLLKLYIERQKNLAGAKIKTKLVVGALALSILPVVCLVIFSFAFLNRTLDKWFTQPTQEILREANGISNLLIRNKSETDARAIAALPDTIALLKDEDSAGTAKQRFRAFADGTTAHYVALLGPGEREPRLEFHHGDFFRGPVAWRRTNQWDEYSSITGVVSRMHEDYVYSLATVTDDGETLGHVLVAWQFPQDLLDRLASMQGAYDTYAALNSDARHFRYFYSGMLALIALFVLFVATWLALFLSKQISVPIEALVEATGELSSGHLDYRVPASAGDELGGLVESFNSMTQQLEAQAHQLKLSNESLAQANVELDSRSQFIDAILESVTPGVISVAASGEISKVNSSLRKMFQLEASSAPGHLREVFSEDHVKDLLHMMKRAQRTGLATREFEIEKAGQIRHLSVTVSSLERHDERSEGEPADSVVVLEDTTELLRAQKSSAWNEVARRVAHEIKNPLTPIALSAERMTRLLRRFSGMEDETPERRKLRQRFEQCTELIVREVETLRTLVDEFSQFARFPGAKLEAADLNRVVNDALDVFQGRLQDVTIKTDLAADLPRVFIDPEQFKRVVVNLIDNAAEAMQSSWLKEIRVTSGPGAMPDTVELIVADSGPGISPEDKEKLFLPYFSTKKRGTGLGLAIVSRILAEHQAVVRVEDNRPSGCRFLIEVPTAASRAPAELGVNA